MLLRTNEKQYKRAARLRGTEERRCSRGARCSRQKRSNVKGLLTYRPDRGEAVQQGFLLLRTHEKQKKGLLD